MTTQRSAASRRAFIQSGAALALTAALPRGAFAQDATAKLRIGVIGAGKIGGTIGGLWVKSGHSVLFSTRHPEELKDLVAGLGPLAHAGTVAEAAAFGDAVFVAVPYGALPQIGRDNQAALKGKVVLDAGNASAGRDGAAIADEVERDGIGVVSQRYLPGTRLVRAFNTMSWMIFKSEANRKPPRLAVPIAGDDQAAVATAANLVRDAGFDPVVVGDLKAAQRFQRGQPGYGQPVPAAELSKILGLGA